MGFRKLRGEDAAGVAVHLAARVAALAGESELLVTRTVRDLVSGSGIEFMAYGEHMFKGFSEPWQIFAAA